MEPSSSAARDHPVAKIFAVDDEETDRQLLQRALQTAKIPYPCRVFSSGAEMLDALLAVLRGAPQPILCFVDVKMAGMSGLDVLRWIRAQHGLHEIPIVMLSSSKAPDHLAEALQFGAQCYTAKFPSPEQLREIVGMAEHFAAAANGGSFPVTCNLLLNPRPITAEA